jgi:RHS repeat-associated protein
MRTAGGDSTSAGTAYLWDAEGQLVGRNGFTQQVLRYDAGGRLTSRVERAGTLLMHDDVLGYDARGKVLAVDARAERHVSMSRYSGLGGLLYSLNRDDKNETQSVEEYRLDPFANYRLRIQSSASITAVQPGVNDAEAYAYQPGTGRLVVRTGSEAGQDSRYDASGNQVQSRTRKRVRTPYDADNGHGELYSNTYAYFGADERLRVLDRKTCILMPNCNPALGPPVSDYGAFEEHRYDALGRRVLTRTRHEQGCVGIDCVGAVVRTVWDGDQILYEISAPGGTNVTGVEMERDTGHKVAVDRDANYYGFGRVAYAHGLGIDDPVSVWRMEYSVELGGPTAIQPTANWAGTYDGGVGGDCVTLHGLESTRLKPEVWPPGEERPRNPSDNGGTITHCVDVDWPAKGVWRNLNEKPTQFHPRKSWMGSLLRHGRDASGQYYRRNRYYDATSGRFTQEDPIGLAGGINLYGYANGDPISYSDPFGLCPAFITGKPCSGVTANVVGAVPYVGDAIDIGGAIMGKDLLTGEKLSGAERLATAVGTVVGSGRLARQALNAAGEAGQTGARIYRGGKANPGNLRTRPGESAVSFRSSLSNPVGSSGRPVFRPGDDYIVVDPSRLPKGSVVYDNVPDGHVSVSGVTPEQLKDAVVDRGRLPQ